MTTTWSLINKNAGIDISANGLSASTQVQGLNLSGRTDTAIVLGQKIWCEITIVLNANDSAGMGWCNASEDFIGGHWIGLEPTGMGLYDDGNVYLNGSPVAGAFFGSGFSAPVVIGLGIDAHNKGYYSVGGVLHGDPVLGTGGIDISALGDLFFAFNVWNQGGTSAQITANFGATAFVFPRPSGWTSSDSPPVNNPDQGTGTGSHRIGRRPKSRKVKGVLEKIEAEQVQEVLPEPITTPESLPVAARNSAVPAVTSRDNQASIGAPQLDGISAKLDRIEGTLRLNAEKARVAKENARIEAARVAKQIEDEEDEFMLLVA